MTLKELYKTADYKDSHGSCINTNRRFIGIELDENYFNIAKERIESLKTNKVIV